MTELIELRRFKPAISHARSYVLAPDENFSDDETFPTLTMIVNTQPIRYQKHDVLVKPILESQYLPSTVIDDEPLVYQRVYTPTLIEERPLALYRSCETPVRRIVQVSPPPPEENVHLPKHTKKLVHRFLNNLEHAHHHRNIDGNESDSSIDDCDVCRQLRSAMNEDLYHNSRVVFETLNSSKHVHSKYCKVCNLLDNSHFGISNRSKQDKHVHVIETFPSNNPPTITSQAPIYPLGYTTFVDPNTGLTYAYDPNWQYNTIPTQSYPSTMDKSTYTRMTDDDDDDTSHKSNNKTVIVHTSRNPTPRTPKIIIEQPYRHHRRSRRNRSTTVVTERITRIPRTKTTTYI